MILDSSQLLFDAFEPKLQNRFIMYLGDTPAQLVRVAKAPSFTDSVVKMDHINSYKKIRGKREWGEMPITLYDPISPSGAQLVMDWARTAYESVTGRAGYQDFYKRELKFHGLGPVGDVVSEWVIKGAFISAADFGSFDWSSDALVDIAVTITYDYAILNY